MGNPSLHKQLRTTTLSICVLVLGALFGCGSNKVDKAGEHAAAGRYQQAIPLLEQEINENPTNAKAHFLLGKCKLAIGDIPGARNCFHRAKRLDSGLSKDVEQELVRSEIAVEKMQKAASKPIETSVPPAMIPDSVLLESIREPVQRSLNENLAAEELQNAQAAFDNRNFRPGNLQKCVKCFKLHLAYLKKRDFDDAENTRMFQTASDELIAEVKSAYHEAWLREKGRLWGDASKEWDRLRVILPHDAEWNTKGYDNLTDNVMMHTAYCRANLSKP
jgi:tetratricopeptide (TPR) repeat protein